MHFLPWICECAGTQWVAWALTEDTLVSVQAKKPLAKDVDCTPMALHSALTFLESLGHVRIKIHLRKCEKVETNPGHYKVEAAESAALEIKQASEGEKITVRNLSSCIDLQKVKGAPLVDIVHKVMYDSSTNKMMSGYPGVHLKQATRVKKADVFQLV